MEEDEDDEESELEVSESDSDTGSDNDNGAENGRDRSHLPANRKRGHKHRPGCAGHAPRPNAYERA